jgi:hypothetical protein
VPSEVGRVRKLAFVVLVVLAAGIACGGRTALFADQPSASEGDDGASSDASSSAGDGSSSGNPPADGSLDGASGSSDGGALGLSSCTAPLGLQKGSPWPIARRCSARGGYTTVIGPSAPKIAWRAPATGTWSPDLVVAADDTVYGYDTARGVVALAPNGQQRWATAVSVPDGRVLDGSLAIGADGTVYVWTGELTAVRPDGSVAWTSEVEADPQSGTTEFLKLAVGPDGTIYVAGSPLTPDTAGVSLYAVSSTGETVWSNTWGLGKLATTSPTVGPDGTVYMLTAAPGDTVSLTAFAPDGSQSWHVDLAAEGSSGSVVTDDGVLLVPCMLDTETQSPTSSLCSIVNGETTSSFPAPPFAALTISPTKGQLLIGAVGLSAYGDEGGLLWSNANWGWPALVDGAGTVYTSAGQGGTTGAMTLALDSRAYLQWKVAAGMPLAFGRYGTLYTLDMGTQEIVAIGP